MFYCEVSYLTNTAQKYFPVHLFPEFATEMPLCTVLQSLVLGGNATVQIAKLVHVLMTKYNHQSLPVELLRSFDWILVEPFEIASNASAALKNVSPPPRPSTQALTDRIWDTVMLGGCVTQASEGHWYRCAETSIGALFMFAPTLYSTVIPS